MAFHRPVCTGEAVRHQFLIIGVVVQIADKAFPVAGSDDEIMLTLYLESDDFAFDWDEDGYAADCVTSLADLPEDTELVSAAFVFEADAEAEDFPAVLAL